MIELVAAALSDAFLQVGVWVGAMLAGFALLQRRGSGRAMRLLQRPGWGPVVGAALGVTPGCGGAIIVMPLYTKGSATFGTVVATLVATMGDSSFVLLAAEPVLGLAVHTGLLVLGVVTGLVVDALGIAPRRQPAAVAARPAGAGRPAPSRVLRRRRPLHPSTVGAAAVEHGLWGRPRLGDGRASLVGFYGLVGVGLVLSVLDLGGWSMPGSGVGLDPVTVLGLTGTAAALAVAVANRGHTCPVDDAHAPTAIVLTRAAQETATIVAWVAAVFVSYTVLVAVTGIELSGLAGAGLLAVLIGAAIGLVPGCGPQLVLTTLYVDGVVGLPMLIANAVSQDGDALLPLLAKDRRAALAATVTSTVPAVLVGTVAWLLLR